MIVSVLFVIGIAGIPLAIVALVLVKENRERNREMEFMRQWGDLARYNAEVHRGVQHAPEYKTKMAQKQTAYNEWIKEQR